MNVAKLQLSRTKTTVSAVGLSVLATFGLGFGAASAWGASPAANAGPGAYLQIMSKPATAEDQLPSEREGVPYLDGAGLRYDTSRYLGSDANAKFWVVTNEQEHICLVNVLEVTGDSSMVCVTPDRFGKQGVAGTVTSFGADGEETGYTEAYLAPDALHFAEVPGGLTAVSDSLVAGDTREAEGALTFTTGDGRAQLEMQLIHPDETP